DDRGRGGEEGTTFMKMAAVQCTRCTAERKGFRRELDTWRHRLIHCVGLESILEGIYGPLLLRDLHLFNGEILIAFIYYSGHLVL
uniref:Uncharacterized protein n=1 Tax=Nothobranchius furzeri TaxID=105023 RepID=A0A8C6K9N1_NOTFU